MLAVQKKSRLRWLTVTWWHQRWMPLPYRPVKWLFRNTHEHFIEFLGDTAACPKTDKLWRQKWRQVTLYPLFHEADYTGCYWMLYKAGGRTRIALLPKNGYVAVRIGDKNVKFAAFSFFWKQGGVLPYPWLHGITLSETLAKKHNGKILPPTLI